MNFLCTWVINKCNGYEARQMSLSRGFVTSRGKNVNCDQALCFYFFSGEKMSANAILRAREEGRVIALGGTYTSAPGHAQSLFWT